MTWVEDNFVTVFGAACIVVAVYMATGLAMVLRLRTVRGKAGQWDGYNGDPMNTVAALRFLWSGEHRRLADTQLTRLVGITRTLFVAAGLSVLTIFALVLGRVA